MKRFHVKGKKRDVLGKADARTARREGMVPCVLYGLENGDNIHFYIFIDDFKDIAYTPEAYRIQIHLDDQVFDTVLQDVQFHPLSDQVVHADFLAIHDEKVIRKSLPLELQGLAAGVKQGGKLQQRLRKLRVKGKVKDLPERIIVDVTSLEAGKSIRVRDIEPDNYDFMESDANPIASVAAARVKKA